MSRKPTVTDAPKETAMAKRARIKTEKAAAAALKEAGKAAAIAAGEEKRNNGIVIPRAGSQCGHVWQIADELSAQTGEPAKRADVMQRATAAGINTATVSTQFARWRKFYGVKTPKTTSPPMSKAVLAEHEEQQKAKQLEQQTPQAPMQVIEEHCLDIVDLNGSVALPVVLPNHEMPAPLCTGNTDEPVTLPSVDIKAAPQTATTTRPRPVVQ